MKKLAAVWVMCGFALSLFAGGAVVEKGTGTFEFEGEFYWPCLDTEIMTSFSVPTKYYVVQTSSGNEVYVEQWLRNELEGFIIELDSGAYWERTKTITTLVSRTTGGESEMLEYTFKSVMVNIDTGERMMVNERMHLSYNAHGDVTVDDYSVNCWMVGSSPK
jgi:hypothetical protein